jgi:hypothetical protein
MLAPTEQVFSKTDWPSRAQGLMLEQAIPARLQCGRPAAGFLVERKWNDN